MGGTGAARSFLYGEPTAVYVLNDVDDLPHTVAMPLSVVERYQFATVLEIIERLDVCSSQVFDVDVVPDTGSIRR
jgi:hypothetical protein